MLFLKLLLLLACLLSMNQTQGNVMMSRPMGREIILVIQIPICKVSELSLFQVKKITQTQGFSFPLLYKGFLLFCHLSSKWEVRGLLDDCSEGISMWRGQSSKLLHQAFTTRGLGSDLVTSQDPIVSSLSQNIQGGGKNLSLENSKKRGNVQVVNEEYRTWGVEVFAQLVLNAPGSDRCHFPLFLFMLYRTV